MPKIDDMIGKTIANAVSLAATPAIDISGISSALENFADFATSLAVPFNTYDTEVNTRPAAQQWTVCTP